MSEQTFKAGDRVRHDSGATGTVLAGPDSASSYAWTQNDDYFRVSFGSQLTLIPDTVTVTLELPREEADWVAQAFTLGADGYDVVGNKVSARVAAAVREALR